MLECTNFRSYKSGTLQGFADFSLPKLGLEIKGCTLHGKEGKTWVNLPSNAYENEQGEKKYAPCVRFIEDSHYEEFKKQAKQAIDKFCMENKQEEPVDMPF